MFFDAELVDTPKQGHKHGSSELNRFAVFRIEHYPKCQRSSVERGSFETLDSVVHNDQFRFQGALA